MQNLYYEIISFHCRTCYETRHSIKNCPKVGRIKARKIDGGKSEYYKIFKDYLPPDLSNKVNQKEEKKSSESKKGPHQAHGISASSQVKASSREEAYDNLENSSSPTTSPENNSEKNTPGADLSKVVKTRQIILTPLCLKITTLRTTTLSMFL